MFGKLKNNLFEALIRCRATVPREMSKQKSKKVGKEQPSTASKIQEQNDGPLSINKEGNVLVKIQAKPGAKQNNITEIGSEAVGVAISAPPVEGEANTELIKYLASVLEVRKSDVTFDRGTRSRHKQVIITGLAKEQILEKLKKELSS